MKKKKQNSKELLNTAPVVSKSRKILIEKNPGGHAVEAYTKNKYKVTIGTKHDGKTATSETVYKTTTFSSESTENLKYKYTETIHNNELIFFIVTKITTIIRITQEFVLNSD